MAGKQIWRLAALLLVLGLAVANTASAGPFFGEWDWQWHPDRNCPRGTYSPLHFWAPSVYQLRAHVHPSNLDQFPLGPSPAVPPIYEIEKHRCPSTPPTPMSPYADPDGYFGRPLVPPRP